MLQSHDVIAQEVYGEDAIRVTPPPPPLTAFDPTAAAAAMADPAAAAPFNATAAVLHGGGHEDDLVMNAGPNEHFGAAAGPNGNCVQQNMTGTVLDDSFPSVESILLLCELRVSH